jgi:hypothetical protein
MSADTQPAKIEMCGNRFGLIISSWDDPVDKTWARDMLERWLHQRVDLTQAKVYDDETQVKGDYHG